MLSPTCSLRCCMTRWSERILRPMCEQTRLEPDNPVALNNLAFMLATTDGS